MSCLTRDVEIIHKECGSKIFIPGTLIESAGDWETCIWWVTSDIFCSRCDALMLRRSEEIDVLKSQILL